MNNPEPTLTLTLRTDNTLWAYIQSEVETIALRTLGYAEKIYFDPTPIGAANLLLVPYFSQEYKDANCAGWQVVPRLARRIR